MKITKQTFDEKIAAGFSGAVDFYADWCSPCKAIAPMLERINTEMGGEKIYKVNVDEEKDLAKQFEIRSIPTIVFFKEGQMVNKIVGMTTKNAILESLNS